MEPMKNCLNCNSTKLTSKDTEVEIKPGFFESFLGDKHKKFEMITCRDCGFVMFFDIEIIRV